MKQIALILAFALGACTESAETADPEQKAKLESGQVALMAVAPDGTKLWGVRTNKTIGRTVYFSSAGTQSSHSESRGKSCVKSVTDTVPNAVPLAQ